MARLFIFACSLVLCCAPAGAASKAAEFLVREQISQACEGSPGQIDPIAVVERDLTGDGRIDLIISHDGITCSNGSRSSFCGTQLCPVNFYVRRGGLLKREHKMLGAKVTVGDGDIPEIQMTAVDGKPGTVKWNGQKFR